MSRMIVHDNLPAPFRALAEGGAVPWSFTRHLAEVDCRIPPFTWWKVTGLMAGDAGVGSDNVLRIVFRRLDRVFAFEVDAATMETTPADFRAFVVEGVRLLLVFANLIPDEGPDWRAAARRPRLPWQPPEGSRPPKRIVA